jgi:predicted CoA-substrate-specific enzyme activase
MKRIGIDIGSLYLGAVVLEDGEIRDLQYREHRGDIQAALANIMAVPAYKDFHTLGVTGNFPERREGVIDNTLALIEGARVLLPDCRNVFAVGGQTFALILFDEQGGYREHSVNAPCAAGTGSFIEQQAERLGLSAAQLAAKAAAFEGKRPVIATRCAVFAKTDIIHAMQEGYSLEAICAGLCDGIARNVLDALIKGREIEDPVGFIGGVSLNRAIAAGMERILGRNVQVPAYSQVVGAVGAATLGGLESFQPGLIGNQARQRDSREPLQLSLSNYPDFGAFSIQNRDGVEIFLPGGSTDTVSDGGSSGDGKRLGPMKPAGGVYIGIDIGSTSTKAVLIDRKEAILGGFYTATGGQPIRAVQSLIRSINRTFSAGWLQILGVATTGSGRMIIKELFNADRAMNEITAHARAAVFLHPQADTIIEIGGQDSKFTLLRDGEVYYSTMNYVCAAGTGSFIEEQAKRLEVSLEEFSEMAFGSRAPFTSDRCTVYMERDLNTLLGEGWSKQALAAAVLNSVRDNYLAKVVSKTALGDYIVFQGATGRNKALVAAFEQHLEKPIHVSPYCHLTGALGAALLCRDSQAEAGTERKKSSFIWEIRDLTISEEICRRCANRCSLTVVETGSRKSGWGMKCGREYGSRRRSEPEPSAPEKRFARIVEPLYESPGVERNTGHPSRAGRSSITIGIPQGLYNLGYAPLWYAFLTRLGFSVRLSKPDRAALDQGKALVNSDFCAPMILAHGYVGQLAEQDVDYLFSPAISSEEDPEFEGTRLYRQKTRDSYYCYYSQYLPTIINKLTAMDVEPKLISPLISFNSMDLEDAAEAIFTEMAGKLPVKLELGEVAEALHRANAAFREQKKRWSRTLSEQLSVDGGDQPNVLLLGRPYVLFDPVLNLGLPAKLEREGARLFWQEEIDLEGFQPEYAGRYYERMHWHFGKQILKAAEYCAQQPNLFAVYLSCFRCSPDSFLLSYVKDIMGQYDKPFLILQLDEHASDIGYATRIEAGLQSFRNYLLANKRPPVQLKTRPRNDLPEKNDRVLIPNLDPLTACFWEACFRKAGYDAALLEPDERALNTGYRYTNGGECMPLISLIGGVIEKVKREALDPEKTFFFIPTTCLACNFSNFPILSDLAFESAGLKGLKIGLINTMAPGEILPQTLATKMLESNILGGVIYKMFHRIMPYELNRGETEEVLWESRERIARAILDGEDLRSVLSGIVEDFQKIERDESAGRKPRIGLIGDLYVKYNNLVNQNVQKVVQDLGGELWIPSLTELPFHFYDADVRLYGDDSRHYRLLKTIEKRYERLAASLIEEQEEPDFAECVELMEEYKVTHYIVGESSINIGRALYYIEHGLVDAILHVNPIFCCPGVVSASIYRRIQEDFGIPIIDIFYDGTGSPNKVLIPYLHYLKR